MKTQLLKKLFSLASIAIVMLFFFNASAQIVYTDIIPDSIISCHSNCGGVQCEKSFSIDLNQDGQDDFLFSVESHPHMSVMGWNVPCGAAVSINSLIGNEVSCDITNQPLALDSNSEIFSGTWNAYGALRRVGGGLFGLWPDSTDKYLGVRLALDTNLYYGWIRLNVIATVDSSAHGKCRLKDYAFNSAPNQPILAGDTSGIATGIISAKNENHFSVSPNPTSNQITLSFSSSEKKQIQITNTLGQIVFAEEINSAKEEIDVSEFPSGMYVVSAQTSAQKIEKKFLKQ